MDKTPKIKFAGFFKPADMILLVVFLALGALCFLSLRLSSASGDTVVISLDGREFGSYPLDVDNDICVDSEYGYNLISIRSGAVSVTESDCPHHDCESFGTISLPAQMIMCLPHHLLVRITGQTEIDAVLY